MFAIMRLGGFTSIGEHITTELQGMYEDMREVEQDAKNKAELKWFDVIEKVLKPSEEQPEQIGGGEESGDSEAPADDSSNPTGTEAGDGKSPTFDEEGVRKDASAG